MDRDNDWERRERKIGENWITDKGFNLEARPTLKNFSYLYRRLLNIIFPSDRFVSKVRNERKGKFNGIYISYI